MDIPTIKYDGVDIPDFGDRRYPYGVIEVTKKCNLRCKTCFFFQAFQHDEGELDEDVLLAKLAALQKRHDIRFVSWVGGEPMLRPRIIERGADIFPAGIIFTNGLLGIPETRFAVALSLDGPPEMNDAIRGPTVYKRVMQNIEDASRSVLIQSVVNKQNFGVLERFTEDLVDRPNIEGVIFSIYVPQKEDASGLGFDMSERDELIDGLLALKDRWGDFIVNERRALELARPETCRPITDACDMKQNSLALDYRLRRRLPCCYGEEVDCDVCAAPTPFSMAARAEGATGLGRILSSISH